MKKILVFLKDYKKESVIAPLFKMLEAILSEYDVPSEEAEKDIDEFIDKLASAKILEA